MKLQKLIRAINFLVKDILLFRNQINVSRIESASFQESKLHFRHLFRSSNWFETKHWIWITSWKRSFDSGKEASILETVIRFQKQILDCGEEAFIPETKIQFWKRRIYLTNKRIAMMGFNIQCNVASKEDCRNR